jgi:Fe2+ transport system protein FeoA
MENAARGTLRELKAGQKGKVVGLLGANPTHLQKMMALGVLPGEKVEVLQTFPTYVIRVGYTQMALDRSLAAIVEVEMLK